MSKPLVSDELWAVVEPLLPKEPPKSHGGRPRVPTRAVLTGILFVLKSGISWELMPAKLGCGSGMTCWRRLLPVPQAGVWEQLHRTLLQRLADAEKLDWSRASLDSASLPANKGRSDRAKSNGSRQTGHEAPCCGRREGSPPRGEALGGQRA